MKQKFLSICLILAIAISLCSGIAISANAGPIELPMIPGDSSSVPTGLKYSIANKQVTITGYTGSATKLTIPGKIQSYPVTVIGECAFYNCTGLTSIVIPDSVTTIQYKAFAYCSNLTNAVLGNGITEIGADAFSYCSNLTNITLGNNVQRIESNAFQGCTRFTEVTIPDSVTYIGGLAFAGCSTLTELTIGTGVTDMGDGAFSDCTDLTSITFLGNAPNMEDYNFHDVTATAYYPAQNDTWTEDVMQDYGGNITWMPMGASLPGDIDGDNIVDNRDVEYLLWYTLFPNDYPLTAEADFDGNTVIDNRDVEYLLWHTLFPNDYPLSAGATGKE